MATVPLAELRLVVGIVVPVFLQMGSDRFVKSSALAFVGRYDPDAIAAAALGNMYGSITGLSVGMGITMAVGSYCSRNFGRGATLENGVVVRHCLSALLLCFIFALSMAEVSPSLLRAFAQPEELAEPVRQFSMISAFAWPGNWIFVCFSTVLSSQHCQLDSTVGQALSSMLFFVLSWSLLSSGSGFLGIAIANVIASWAGVAYVVILIIARGRQSKVWQVPAVVSTEGQLTLGQYLRSAIPMASSMWGEWWALEIMALFAGWLPGRQISVAAHGILFNTLLVVYMAFIAVSRACMIRVGHQVGARDVPGIRLSIRVCLVVAVSMSCVVAGLLEVFGGHITSLFTHHLGILDTANHAFLGVVLSVPPYSVTLCLMGALRSAGLQVWGAKALFVSYYVVGLPFGYCLGVVGPAGLLGIWLGNAAALSCSALTSLAKITYFDWDIVVGRPECEDAVTAMAAPATASQTSPLLGRQVPTPPCQHPTLIKSCRPSTAKIGGAKLDTPRCHPDIP